jgi:hypothetical protein
MSTYIFVIRTTCTTLEYRGKTILLTLIYSLNDAQKSQSKVQTR